MTKHYSRRPTPANVLTILLPAIVAIGIGPSDVFAGIISHGVTLRVGAGAVVSSSAVGVARDSGSGHDMLLGTDVFSRNLHATASARASLDRVGSSASSTGATAVIQRNGTGAYEVSANYVWTDTRTEPIGASFGTGSGSRPAFEYEFTLDAPTVAHFWIETRNADGVPHPNFEVILDSRGVLDHTVGTPALLAHEEIVGISLAAGDHVIRVDNWTGGSTTGPALSPQGGYETTFLFSLTGDSAANPVLPTFTEDGSFIFEDVISNLWYDPIATDGYRFDMRSDSLFTSIDALPSFLTNPVIVSANGTILGQFGAGESVDFSPLGGVSSFEISGINPVVDGEDPLAFPIQLSFDSGMASFSMTPIAATSAVPEPSSIVLLATGLLGLIGYRRCRVRRSSAPGRAAQVSLLS